MAKRCTLTFTSGFLSFPLSIGHAQSHEVTDQREGTGAVVCGHSSEELQRYIYSAVGGRSQVRAQDCRIVCCVVCVM